ncbi:MAG: metallopeptidase family protein [Myxococcota bacterium]
MTGTTTLDEVLDLAYEALYEGEVEEARRLLDKARQLDSQDRDVLLLEADVFEAEGAGEEAIAAVEEALRRYKGDLPLTFRHATLLMDVYEDVAGARPLLEDVVARLEAGELSADRSSDKRAANDNEEEEQADPAMELLFEALLALSDCRSADHDPVGCLAAAERAVALAPEDATARLVRAAAQFDLCQLEEAEKGVAQALDRDPRLADAYWLRGRILTVRGDEKGATKACERAATLDGERFRAPLRVSEDEFVRLMERSLEELPAKVRTYLRNVAIAVEDIPPLERLRLAEPPLSPGSLGLYEGTPPSLAPGDDPWAHLPSQITLFRKNIELAARDEEDLQDLVATTLLHEVGHYLGLDEDELEARGLD